MMMIMGAFWSLNGREDQRVLVQETLSQLPEKNTVYSSEDESVALEHDYASDQVEYSSDEFVDEQHVEDDGGVWL